MLPKGLKIGFPFSFLSISISLIKTGLENPVPKAFDIASFPANCLARYEALFDSFKVLNILNQKE